MKALITSQFLYCPLVWMFHSRTMNNRINTLHEKALRLVYTNKPNLSFDDLLKEDKSVKIHQKNLQILATEIYKVKNDLGPKIMADIFHSAEKPHNLRNHSTTQRQANRTVYFGTENISSLVPKLLELIPSEIKSAKSLNIFKEKRNLRQQVNALVGFVRCMLETLVSFSGVLKDETLNPPSCHFIIFFFSILYRNTLQSLCIFFFFGVN